MSLTIAIRQAESATDRLRLERFEDSFEPVQLAQDRIKAAETSLSALRTTLRRLNKGPKTEGYEPKVSCLLNEIVTLSGIIRSEKLQYKQVLREFQHMVNESWPYGKWQTSDLVALERESQKLAASQNLAEQLLKQDAMVSAQYDLDESVDPNMENMENKCSPVEIVAHNAAMEVSRGLDKAIDQIEKARYEARLAHSLRNRHKLRRLRLLDLPNEILVQVIKSVDWVDVNPFFNRDLDSFKNVRLTCRQLYTISSPLLVPALTVVTSRSSIAHLLEVSRHPLVAQGVRRIYLKAWAPYDVHLARSIDLFTTSCLVALKFILSRINGPKDTPPMSGRYSNALQKITEAITAIMAGNMAECPNMVVQAYEQYGERFREQEALSEEVINTIADAMARMPQARRLHLSANPYHPPIHGSEADVDRVFAVYNDQTAVDFLIKYICIQEELGLVSRELSVPTNTTKLQFSLIQQLPGSIARLGGHLKELEIAVYGRRLDAVAVISDEALDDLRWACQQLTSLTIQDFCGYSYRPSTSETHHSSTMRAVAEACVGSPVLQNLELQALECMNGGVSVSSSLTLNSIPALSAISSSHLKVLGLECLSIQYSDLMAFLSKLPESSVAIIMEHVTILGDRPWFRLVDLLRAKSNEASSLHYVTGEWTTPPSWMDWEEHSHEDLLTRYITGRSDHNPLLSPPPQVECEEDQEDQEQNGGEEDDDLEENTEGEDDDDDWWPDELAALGSE